MDGRHVALSSWRRGRRCGPSDGEFWPARGTATVNKRCPLPEADVVPARPSRVIVSQAEGQPPQELTNATGPPGGGWSALGVAGNDHVVADSGHAGTSLAKACMSTPSISPVVSSPSQGSAAAIFEPPGNVVGNDRHAPWINLWPPVPVPVPVAGFRRARSPIGSPLLRRITLRQCRSKSLYLRGYRVQ